MDRRLAAILATDVVGYSRLIRADEEGTIAALKALRADLVDPKIAEHHGRIVKLMGDGMLAEFPSVVDAMRAAVETQQAVAEHNSGLPDDKRIEFRVGINLGDIVIDGDDIQGDGVNVAARLEELAAPGGICISGNVYDEVRDRIDEDFEDLGLKEIKNIDRPIRIWKWSPGRIAAKTAAHVDKPLSRPNKPSIAVLALDNMSADSEQEYFADGISEDIITELSRFRDLFVIGRHSSFSYKGRSVPVSRIAEELGVRYVLEGSVRRAGDRVRINAQLLDTDTGSHIWAERYDREVTSIFDLQEEITREVVASIAPQITRAEFERVSARSDVDFTAYDLALKADATALEGIRTGVPSVLEHGLQIGQRALDIDPRCSRAMQAMIFGYAMQCLYRWGSDPDAALVNGLDMARRALEIDSLDHVAFAARGMLLVFRDDYDDGIGDLLRAHELNPNDSRCLVWLAWCESMAGLPKDAKEHAALALRLSPRDIDIWLGGAYLAMTQASFALQEFQEARHWAQLSIQMHPNAPMRRALMIAACVLLDRQAEAQRHIAALNAFAPDFIATIIHGRFRAFKLDKDNALLVEGLRKATGRPDAAPLS